MRDAKKMSSVEESAEVMTTWPTPSGGIKESSKDRIITKYSNPLLKRRTMLDTDAGWTPLYLSTIAGEFLVAPAATAAATAASTPESVRPWPPSLS
jgi:hypothetical protein